MPAMAEGSRSGSSLGGRTEESPKRKQRRAAARKREEKRWAARSGPVTTRFVDPASLRPGGAQSPPSGPDSPA